MTGLLRRQIIKKEFYLSDISVDAGHKMASVSINSQVPSGYLPLSIVYYRDQSTTNSWILGSIFNDKGEWRLQLYNAYSAAISSTRMKFCLYLYPV